MLALGSGSAWVQSPQIRLACSLQKSAIGCISYGTTILWNGTATQFSVFIHVIMFHKFLQSARVTVCYRRRYRPPSSEAMREAQQAGECSRQAEVVGSASGKKPGASWQGSRLHHPDRFTCVEGSAGAMQVSAWRGLSCSGSRIRTGSLGRRGSSADTLSASPLHACVTGNLCPHQCEAGQPGRVRAEPNLGAGGPIERRRGLGCGLLNAELGGARLGAA
jgi:hypothetical protein